MNSYRKSPIALIFLLTVVLLNSPVPAVVVDIRLEPGDIGSHASEGSRTPDDSTQYNRSEVFVGYSTSSDLLSLRALLGFNLSAIPSNAHIEDVSLGYRINKVDSGDVTGVQLYKCPEAVVESGFDWDTPDGTTPWTVSWVAAADTGLGTLLSTDTTTFNHDATNIRPTMTDTTGQFTPAVRAAFAAGDPFTVIMTSLDTEMANTLSHLLRIDSDDAATANRPVLSVEYSLIQPTTQAGFFNMRQLDFESFANGYLDATAVNPTINQGLIDFGIESITGSDADTGSDYQNQSSPNGKGLFFDGTRFVILPKDNDPFDNGAYPFRHDQTFTIDFAETYDQFGLSFHDQTDQDFTFTFYLDGLFQGQYVQSVPVTWDTGGHDLFGFTTPFQFDRVVVNGSNSGDGIGIDNITVGRVPEPSTALLLALSLAAGFWMRRRRG